MMHTTQALYDALNTNLIDIDRQIEAVKNSVMAQQPLHETPDPNVVYKTQTRFGTFVLTDLLAARAQCLSGMAALKAADVSSKAPRR